MKVLTKMTVELNGNVYEVGYDDFDGSANGCQLCFMKDTCPGVTICTDVIGSDGYLLEIKD